ncbi:alpha-amylase family glycosyl hydrolase [Halorussus gelatinilyticus]|uniref:Alpha-amylase family glycosyl hydrolase n=1 Tax=Halorussus gelatinilyticus TaxID=2937524 RepID=A0A8U0IL08_9EURY|nr:alpha-amylase family glycosyl hydrolase [Halorussus gelatinilyticus]UPW01012.1 alpha-amylase family glycosyl hydrolase [Halorussus gelatinilyticus]
MHEPGPPRFVHAGESVELAPRRPTPDADFSWRVRDRPADSEAGVGDGAVVHLEPDEPGVYELELHAPDGTHRQTVRAFPDPRREARFSLPVSDLSVPEAEITAVSLTGLFNDYTLGRDRMVREGDEFVAEYALPPGDHEGICVVNDDFEHSHTVDVSVPGAGRPRVHLDGRVEDGTLVVTARAEAAPAGSDPEVEFWLDDRDDLSESAVETSGPELRAPVAALPDRARIHAVAVAERHSVADTLVVETGADESVEGSESADESEADSGNVAVSRPNDPPEWAEEATVYQIFVRRFAGETVETTFEEIERRVPYLESLDVDCLWLTPVVGGPTDHGYHVTDYFDTAADLGTRAEFESLVETLREAGVRVVFDLVINHTSRDHPAFQMHSAGVPEYADHYERVPADPAESARDATDTDDVDWAGEGAPGYYFNWTRIPNLNYDSLAVREWMLDVVEEWAPLVDGYRADVAWGVPHGFWKEVRERLKDAESEFLLLDETIPRDPQFHENEFDAHYDTALYGALREVGRGEAPAEVLFDALEANHREGFPESSLLLRYVENHDETRYVEECDEAALRAAAAATFTLPGAPMIYYGQERGVADQRGEMKWYDGDSDLTAHHRRLSELRSERSVLRRGDVERVEREFVRRADGDRPGDGDRPVDADQPADADRLADDRTGGGRDDRTPDPTVAYARDDGDSRVVVVLNFGAESREVALGEPVGTTDLLTGESVAAGDGVEVADAVVLECER